MNNQKALRNREECERFLGRPWNSTAHWTASLPSMQLALKEVIPYRTPFQARSLATRWNKNRMRLVRRVEFAHPSTRNEPILFRGLQVCPQSFEVIVAQAHPGRVEHRHEMFNIRPATGKADVAVWSLGC